MLLVLLVFNQNYVRIMLVFKDYASFSEIMLSQINSNSSKLNACFYIVTKAKHVVVSNVVKFLIDCSPSPEMF